MKKIFTLLLLSSAWLANAQNNFDAVGMAPDGYWTFEDGANLGKAEPGYGSDLTLVGDPFTQVTISPTEHVIRKTTTSTTVDSYLEWTHGLPANGGGTKVNQWTIMIDFTTPQVNIWNALFQAETGPNDSILYIKNASLGSGTIWGYYTGTITANTWYRYVVTVDLSAASGSRAQLYVNGVQWANGCTKALDDSRVSLSSIVHFLGDALDKEQGPIDISQIAFWGRALVPAEVVALGGTTLAAPKFSIADNTLKVYPNPVSSNARISFNMPSASKNANIELIDMTGRVVENIYRGSLDQGEQTISWSLKSKYNAGTYLVKLSSENTNQVYSILMK